MFKFDSEAQQDLNSLNSMQNTSLEWDYIVKGTWLYLTCYYIFINIEEGDVVWLSMRQPPKTYKLQTFTSCLKIFNNGQISTP